MNCPVDNEVLRMTERQGVEVDYCPRCRGVWLDRGELDKILDRAATELGAAEDRGRDDDRDRYGSDRYRDDRESARSPYPPKKRKRSFLSDMFEFGDD